ncbi:methyltransferase N6AMT1 [Teleopsis dalmanni]|uniref:methyltransferase N6AMT1 n=1 Tax=Teleopsis dalmanni TaxID=139649 RepID=UPI0018CD12C5|nr:methyltransferase N6AMT1 [Teleopsis dalmanni]
METPFINHLTADDFTQVYEPAQDTFLLLDALEDDLSYLRAIKPHICLEVGTGSGIIITALAKILTETLCLATDINPFACTIAKRTARRNDTNIDTIRTNLVDALRPNSIDLLIFNPPYVATSDEEFLYNDFCDVNRTTSDNLIRAWAGGHNGIRIVDELLEKLDNIMSKRGVMYMLLLRENNPKEIMNKLGNLNFETSIFKERRIPGEYLYILKVWRTSYS